MAVKPAADGRAERTRSLLKHPAAQHHRIRQGDQCDCRCAGGGNRLGRNQKGPRAFKLAARLVTRSATINFAPVAYDTDSVNSFSTIFLAP
jgi:hypothetical protein